MQQSFSAWFWDNCLHLFVILLSSTIVYLMMIGLLQVKRKPDSEHPSTFFSLDQITSRTWFRSISFFFGGSAAVLYSAIAFQGGTFVGTIKKILASYATAGVQGGGKEIDGLFAAVPSWLDPLFILLAFLLLFAARIRAPLLIYRDLIVSGAGFYSMVDETSLGAARAVIDRNLSFEAATQKLESTYHEAPVPEELADQRNEKRIAYQLIWHVLSDIREFGALKAFSSAKARLGLAAPAETSVHVDVALTVAAAAIFFILMGLYVVVVPTFGVFLRPHGVEWPDPSAAGWSYLIISILKNTLAFAFPLLLAINMYPLRRHAYGDAERPLASFAIVGAVQWISAFIVLEIFNVMDVSFAYFHSQYDYTLGLPRLHIGAFLYAMCPVVAFLAWIRLRPKVGALWVLAGIICTIVAASFFLCDVIYECYSGFTFFFFHQALLGLFITFAFFVAASMTKALEENREQALHDGALRVSP